MNEFMSEWDGLMSANNGVIILGATNRPFDLDDAILRRMPRRVLIDLPDESARKKILDLHLAGETIDPLLSLDDIAKRTHLYSGSDLKNMCVSAALTKVKEDLLYHAMKSEEEMKNLEHKEQLDRVHAKLDELQDFSSIASSKVEFVSSPLSQYHFDTALKDVGPSLTDEMATLVELRKWDSMYGEATKKKKKPSWGFSTIDAEKTVSSK